eukprot:TRINITY_DN4568_c0_g2_i1.p1 TRINITY_DN4568_c0_g2~~TRINITY_DN4568_c0_g2_i1.p1  ORF type:complete len:369 (+),score=30.36 TRINITY_DN4568_c0_g2_i1:68-1108(+)
MPVAGSAILLVGKAALLSGTLALSLQLGQQLSPEPQSTRVWVTAFARSSSSTVLSMVQTAPTGLPGFDPQKDLFSLFEPCHPLDQVNVSDDDAHCQRLLARLMQCNFSGVDSLHGWGHDHSFTGGDAYSQDYAESRCRQARFVVMKTVNVTNPRPDAVERRGSAPVPYSLNLAAMGGYLLGEVPGLRIINVVRDPRAVYASMMKTPAFELVIAREPETLTSICDSMLASVNVHHPRVLEIRYESFVKHPELSARRVMEFLEMPFGSNQIDWINKTFGHDCVTHKGALYDDCHPDPEAGIAKWESVLTPREVEVFENHPACCELAKRRKYPLGNCDVTELEEQDAEA